ncbi:Calcium homeostasis protein [Neofusicoccum parvum]|uniref:Putative calcium homeostasis protein n=1 Tax=Botryosphaeria parva (strain UCR-NP2) TaxID=1287680 RepID=R1H373_BOTPV|nr:putative calcium homeostasis protein [Neofusicoccum parvum UCRNP2]GME32314.1 Calcium homeostasis protein [Neofusicoccum parvum]
MSDIKTYTVDEPYLKIDCGLGEGPFWEEATNTLRFVDVIKQKLHAIDLSKGPESHKVIADLDISIGVTADIEGDDEHLFFGGKHGYGILNRRTAKYKYIKKYWSDKEVAEGKEKLFRGNDGAVDSKGRFFVGVMNDPLVKSPEPEGTLFRLDPDLTLHRVLEGVHIPNGISWTPDDKTMFYTDSPTKNVFAFDYDITTGSFSNKRVFYHVEEGEHGVPDGHALDTEGHMWIAIHGAGKVLRVSPEGKKVAEIRLPTRCPTCPEFAGEDLYITSAAEEMPDQFPESTKLHGSLFKAHVGVRGAPSYRFTYNGEKP